MKAFRYYTRGIIASNYFLLNWLQHGDMENLVDLEDMDETISEFNQSGGNV